MSISVVNILVVDCGLETEPVCKTSLLQIHPAALLFKMISSLSLLFFFLHPAAQLQHFFDMGWNL